MTCAASWMRLGQTRKLAVSAVAALSLAFPAAASAQSVTLPEGLAIRLETRHDISSKKAKVGDPVELAVSKPVVIGGATVIPTGTPAVGEVIRVSDNGLLGRSGKLDISVSKLSTGQMDIPVRGQRNAKGKSGTLGAVGAGIVFFPLAVIVRGKDVKLPAGTGFDVYVDQEVVMAPASATPDPAQPAAAPATDN